MNGQCPNCAGDMVDSLCNCGHDGKNVDCQCEYCREGETADLATPRLSNPIQVQRSIDLMVRSGNLDEEF